MENENAKTPRRLIRRQRGYLESLWRRIRGTEPAPQEKNEYEKDGEEVIELLWQLF